jgi:coniferyl-aldehyde dehydrogenase
MNAPLTNDTNLPVMESLFARQHEASRAEVAAPLALRRDRLQRLRALLTENASRFEAAISSDFGHRSVHETRLAEAFMVESSIKHAVRHLARWMSPRRISTTLPFWPGSNRLIPQPLGVVGVISPWNYPLQLTLAPVVGALAAGNRVMIKPSELSPRFAGELAAALAARFSNDEIALVTGGPIVAHAFAALAFDHLVFTGSTRVGQLVAEAAARNLTPVTLELGGKSPTILDRSAVLATAAERIAYAKLLNAGQTCIAPDYVLCPRGLEATFAERFFAAVERLYGTNPDNPDYTAIVSEAHYDRLGALLTDAAANGGRIETRVAEFSFWKRLRKLPPYLIHDTTDGMRVRQEEIFGPILPIVTYETPQEAIAFVNARARPLALYWFGSDRAARDRVLQETVSGGVTINDCLLHIAQENQPFGGVGASGMGAYHGEWGFRRFSQLKPVFHQSRASGAPLLRPPYGATFDRVLALLRRVT